MLYILVAVISFVLGVLTPVVFIAWFDDIYKQT